MPGRDSDINTTSLSRFIALLAVIILVSSAWFWWRNVYMSADNVFWGMMSGNLTTTSVTRHIVQSTNNKSVDQYIREQFGSLNAAESTVTLKREDASGLTVIRSETIGTTENDYGRYLSINTPEKTAKGKPIDTSNVIGIWGKSVKSKDAPGNKPQYFQQSILTILPFGNFNQQQRNSLINQIRSQKVYDFSVGSAKSQKLNGRSVFVYKVNINAAAYIELMQSYVRDLGLGDIGLDPASYVGSPPLSAEITVDKIARQVVKINYPTTGQSETVTDQNLDNPITLPTTTIPIDELQNRIQKNMQ